MTVIRTIKGSRLTISRDYLTLPGRCHNVRMKLTDIRTGFRTGTYVPKAKNCMFTGLSVWDQSDKFSVNTRRCTVGCCTFAKTTWAIIMEARRRARNRSAKI